jgi:hypothetical protein
VIFYHRHWRGNVFTELLQIVKSEPNDVPFPMMTPSGFPAGAGKAKGKAKAKVALEESEMEVDEEDDDGVKDAEVKEEDDEDDDEDEDEEPISGTLKRKVHPSQSKARQVKKTKRVVEGSAFTKAQVGHLVSLASIPLNSCTLSVVKDAPTDGRRIGASRARERLAPNATGRRLDVSGLMRTNGVG